MRLRFLVPRRGRRAGLGGLAAAVALAGCGGPPLRASASSPPVAAPAFAVGIDEHDPHLLTSPDVRRLRPAYVRVLVDWSTYQPDAARPPDWALRRDGCDRGAPPCTPWNGIRDELRAVRAIGAIPVMLVYDTPAWAAGPPAGCEPPGVRPGARMPRLGPYRAMLASLRALTRREGVEPYWSPWNEPNLPVFLNPQRSRCDADAPSVAAGRYARIVRSAIRVLGADRIVVGEASGVGRHPHATGAAELARALPDELVCGAAAWTQHAYVSAVRGERRTLEPVPLASNEGLLRDVERALDAHRCKRPPPIWITETGAGDRPGACEDMAAQLRSWRRDPRVRAAFQYTFRDDPLFPTGLADPGLTRLYPAYEAWRTRGASCA